MVSGPIEPGQRRVAERRLLDTLRRLQRREPLRSDVRVDRLISEVRAADPARPSAHRGRQPLTLTDAELRAVVDALVASGAMHREGHRVSLPDHGPALDPIMRERVDRLLQMLREGGATPAPAELLAKRLGIPVALIEQLRASGELVSAGTRIDYPRDVWADINARLSRLAGDQPLSGRVVRDALATTRRHAEAILVRRRIDDA